MKTILSCCLVIILAVSCQMKQNQNSDESIDENMSVDNTETCMVDTVKATAIFWIDKNKKLPSYMSGKPVPIRTLKAQVEIDTVGSVEVLSYVKSQTKSVERHVNWCLETFKVKKVLMDSAYIKPGIQYVQLRYTPSKMKD